MSGPTPIGDSPTSATVDPAGAAGPQSSPAVERPQRAIDLLRIMLGVVWAGNLIFIFVPGADFWNQFSAVASSYGPTTPSGSGLTDFVASQPLLFSMLVAAVSVYLAVAFLAGFTTRLACAIGFLGSLVLFWTQYGSTFTVPGGTDVGAHPLYLAIYVALYVGGAGRLWSVDSWLWKSTPLNPQRFGRWIATPSP